MADDKRIRTTKKQIVEYWEQYVDESSLSIDFAEAGERCWRCGCKRNLERCHIIPQSLNGEDVPSNFVLLCSRCHLDNPNVADPEVMWDWLRAYKVSFYDTFWIVQGMKEYEKIYGKSFKEELKARKIDESDSGEIYDIMKEQVSKASYHFGDPHLNVATLAGIIRMTIKEYDKRHGRETERNVKPYIRLAEYW